MAGTGKQTALFFGFLAAAMTHASAQASAAPSMQGPAGQTAAVERLIADSGATPRALKSRDAQSPGAVRDRP